MTSSELLRLIRDLQAVEDGHRSAEWDALLADTDQGIAHE